MAKFPSFEALNEWLTQRCREIALRKHPTLPSHSIADCFAEEQAALRTIIVLAAVALANKMARISWAMMVNGTAYRAPKAA